MSNGVKPINIKGIVAAHKDMLNKRGDILKIDHQVDAYVEKKKREALADEAEFKKDQSVLQVLSSLTSFGEKLAGVMDTNSSQVSQGAEDLVKSGTVVLPNQETYDVTTANLSIDSPNQDLIDTAIRNGMSESDAIALYGVEETYNVGANDNIDIPALNNRIYKVSTDSNGNQVYEDVTKLAVSDKDFVKQFDNYTAKDKLAILQDKIKSIFGKGTMNLTDRYIIGGKQYTGTDLKEFHLNPLSETIRGTQADDIDVKNILIEQYGDKINIDPNSDLHTIQRQVAGYEVSSSLFKEDFNYDASGNLVDSSQLSPELSTIKDWADKISPNMSDKQILEHLETEFKEYDPIKIENTDTKYGTMPSNLAPYEIPTESTPNLKGVNVGNDGAVISSLNNQMDAFTSVNNSTAGNPMEKKTSNQKQFDWLMANQLDELLMS